MLLPCGGGAFRRLGKRPSLGFTDRREVIPTSPQQKGTQPGAFSISRTDNGYFALTYPKMASAKNTMSGAIISMLKFISSLSPRIMVITTNMAAMPIR